MNCKLSWGYTCSFNQSLYSKSNERHNFHRAYLEATMKLDWINHSSDTPTSPVVDTTFNKPGTPSDSLGNSLQTCHRKRDMSSASIIPIDSIHEQSFSVSSRHVDASEEDIDRLEEQVKRWGPASHAIWAILGGRPSARRSRAYEIRSAFGWRGGPGGACLRI